MRGSSVSKVAGFNVGYFEGRRARLKGKKVGAVPNEILQEVELELRAAMDLDSL